MVSNTMPKGKRVFESHYLHRRYGGAVKRSGLKTRTLVVSWIRIPLSAFGYIVNLETTIALEAMVAPNVSSNLTIPICQRRQAAYGDSLENYWLRKGLPGAIPGVGVCCGSQVVKTMGC